MAQHVTPQGDYNKVTFLFNIKETENMREIRNGVISIDRMTERINYCWEACIYKIMLMTEFRSPASNLNRDSPKVNRRYYSAQTQVIAFFPHSHSPMVQRSGAGPEALLALRGTTISLRNS